MGLFGKKQQTSSTDEATTADVLIDATYRKELQALGRDQFTAIIAKQNEYLEKEIATIMEHVAGDVKNQVARKVDMLMGRLNAEVTNQLNDRMREFNRVSGESQELVAQSLSRNAQMVHEKYQQLSLDLQRTVANQEVVMAAIFQDSKTQLAAAQSEQSKILEQLRADGEKTRRDAEELNHTLRETVQGQAEKLSEVYQANMDGVESTRSTQATMLETLTRATQALEDQYQQLGQLLDKSLADQKAMFAEVIDENMARIIEHYLIGALGEQSNIREQLPSIIKQMEENKQAMMDDMKL